MLKQLSYVHFERVTLLCIIAQSASQEQRPGA
jgi:hypothetical protein